MISTTYERRRIAELADLAERARLVGAMRANLIDEDGVLRRLAEALHSEIRYVADNLVRRFNPGFPWPRRIPPTVTRDADEYRQPHQRRRH